MDLLLLLPGWKTQKGGGMKTLTPDSMKYAGQTQHTSNHARQQYFLRKDMKKADAWALYRSSPSTSCVLQPGLLSL